MHAGLTSRAPKNSVSLVYNSSAQKRLSTEPALEGAAVLWRGIKDKEVPESFLRKGGAELAPSSASPDLKVALRYAARNSRKIVLFRIIQVCPYSSTTWCQLDWHPEVSEGTSPASHFPPYHIAQNNFMECAPSISFLSAFPQEKEHLYPPLTFFNVHS